MATLFGYCLLVFVIGHRNHSLYFARQVSHAQFSVCILQLYCSYLKILNWILNNILA